EQVLVQNGVPAIPDVAKKVAGFFVTQTSHVSVRGEEVSALIGVSQVVQHLPQLQIASLAKVFARFPYVRATGVGKSMPSPKRLLNLSLRPIHQHRPYAFHRPQTHAGTGACGVDAECQLLKQGFVRSAASDPSELGQTRSDLAALYRINPLQ